MKIVIEAEYEVYERLCEDIERLVAQEYTNAEVTIDTE